MQTCENKEIYVLTLQTLYKSLQIFIAIFIQNYLKAKFQMIFRYWLKEKKMA